MKTKEISSFEQLNQAVQTFKKEYPTPRCFALHGNLGSGKTTFVKAFAQQLGLSDLVTSPTYSIVNEYGVGKITIYHLDLYRLHDAKEALDIGVEEILDHNGYVFIEWPEIIENLLPENTINVYFSYTNKKRSLTYE